MALRPEMARRAQAIYDSWEQGEDDDLGGGGICDEVASAISDVLASSIAGVELEEYGHEGDDHAAVMARLGPERYLVDIPYWVYESGGGYSWEKRPGVRLSPADVVVEAI